MFGISESKETRAVMRNTNALPVSRALQANPFQMIKNITNKKFNCVIMLVNHKNHFPPMYRYPGTRLFCQICHLYRRAVYGY